MIGLHIHKHEVDVDEISLQTQGSNKAERTVHPLRRAAEDAVHHEHRTHSEGYVKHSLNEEREVAVTHLLKIEARAECHQECQ